MSTSATPASPAAPAAEGGNAPPPPARRAVLEPRVIASADLFGQQVEVVIEHRSQRYRLRQTSLGKLILTK